MRADKGFLRYYIQRARKSLGQPAAVDEDQRRLVALNEFKEPRMNGRPDGTGTIRTVRTICSFAFIDRHFDRELDSFPVRCVDDRDRSKRRGGVVNSELVVDVARRRVLGRLTPAPATPPGLCAAKEAGDFVERALRGGETYPL